MFIYINIQNIIIKQIKSNQLINSLIQNQVASINLHTFPNSQIEMKREGKNSQQVLKSVQLIYFDQNKNVHINPHAADLISKFQTQQMHIVTVAGKYRTGKSYILNHVLLNCSSGFQVGSTINACTKGLWMWPQLVKIQHRGIAKNCLIVDTEGLGSLQQGQNTDIKIFLMAMLLSSYLIYNSVGNIDQKAIQSLSLVVNLANMLNKQSDSYDSQQLINSFPSLMWLVRDFSLRLENQQGQIISASEYLDKALKVQKGVSKNVDKKNQVRRQLKTFFQKRDCFTLIRPTQSQKDLQNLNTLPSNKLRPQFTNLVAQFKQKVSEQIKPKKIRGKSVTPQAFIQLCRYFIGTLNSGKLPSINSHWETLCMNQAARILEQYRATHMEFLIGQIQNQELSEVALKSIQKRHQQRVKQAEQKIQKSFLGKLEKQLSKEKLKKILNQTYQQIVFRIDEKQYIHFQSILSQVFKEIISDFKDRKLQSFQEILDKFESIREQYRGNSRVYQSLYQNSKDIFKQFVKNLQQHWQKQHFMLFSKNNLLETLVSQKKAQNKQKIQQISKQKRQLQGKLYKSILQKQKLQRQNLLLCQQKNRIYQTIADIQEQNNVLRLQKERVESDKIKQLQKDFSYQIQNMQVQKQRLEIKIAQMSELYRQSDIRQRKTVRQSDVLKNKCSQYLRSNIQYQSIVQALQKKVSDQDRIIRKLKSSSKAKLIKSQFQDNQSKDISQLYNQENEIQILQFKLRTLDDQKKGLIKLLNQQRQINQTLMKYPQNVNYVCLKKVHQSQLHQKECLLKKCNNLEIIIKYCSQFKCRQCLKSLSKDKIIQHQGECCINNLKGVQFDVSYTLADDIQFEIEVRLEEINLSWSIFKSVKSLDKLLTTIKMPCDSFRKYQIIDKSCLRSNQVLMNLYEQMRFQLETSLSRLSSQELNTRQLKQFFGIDIHLRNKLSKDQNKLNNDQNKLSKDQNNPIKMRKQKKGMRELQISDELAQPQFDALKFCKTSKFKSLKFWVNND